MIETKPFPATGGTGRVERGIPVVDTQNAGIYDVKGAFRSDLPRLTVLTVFSKEAKEVFRNGSGQRRFGGWQVMNFRRRLCKFGSPCSRGQFLGSPREFRVR